MVTLSSVTPPTCTLSWFYCSRRCVPYTCSLDLTDWQTINPSTPSLFKARPSPFSRAGRSKNKGKSNDEPDEEYDTSPKKLEWKLTPDLRAGVRYAETRISDLICQNDSQALEFKGYGSAFIKRHGFSPDAFVQMAFQAAYYGLYGEYFAYEVRRIADRQGAWSRLMSQL